MAPSFKIAINDFLPRFQLPNHRGKGSDLFRHARGKPIALLFLPSDEAECLSFLNAITEGANSLEEQAHVIAMSDRHPEQSAKLAEETEFPFPIVFDESRQIATALGHIREDQPGESYPERAALYLADPNRRLSQVIRPEKIADALPQLLNGLADLQPGSARTAAPSAPVLLVPNALDPEHCERLIRLWETGGNSETGVFRGANRDAGGLIDRTTKSRRDHVVTEHDVAQELAGVIGKRVAADPTLSPVAHDVRATIPGGAT